MEVVEQVTSRDKTIVKTGLVGIAANTILAAIKSVVGFASGSIAIILDAVNNLSDALSSVITIVGIKIAGKSPDKEQEYEAEKYPWHMKCKGTLLIECD